jgi:hypothetical protein
MDKGKCSNWAALFALVAAVGATASTPALADKGGQGRALGVPGVDLGLPKISGPSAAAAPFVPTPQLYVAPGLMRGPVGNGNVPGAAAPGALGLTPSHGLTPPGHRDDAINGVSPAAARDPAAATDRITAGAHASDRGMSQVSEPTPRRQLPTCR